MKSRKRKRRGRASPLPWLAISAICLSLAAALVVYFLTISTTASSVAPSPKGQPVAQRQAADFEEQGADLRFPVVDWEYWKSVNPAVIAWVTVPGTHINYAIVQAPESAPTYYLTYDIYGQVNPYGCPYADADGNGTEGFNTVIFGHNILGRFMFGEFANYSDKAFANTHLEVLFQTPDEQTVLNVSAVSIVRGTEKSKRTDFETEDELSEWYFTRYANAKVQIANDSQARRLITFVTCSYHYFSNERTLVYTQPEN
jgi:sortase B